MCSREYRINLNDVFFIIRSYHSSQSEDVTWTHKYYKYEGIFKKKIIGKLDLLQMWFFFFFNFMKKIKSGFVVRVSNDIEIWKR